MKSDERNERTSFTGCPLSFFVPGTIVAQGTPEQVAKAGKGHTGRFLVEELRTSQYV